ncbi:MAG TPA: lactate utilization protein LutB domain-containing protein, partial [Candidatus Sulfotelmatobacter sp.]|nr:lactate utilization protein LutB domain-containing protein [Candidatus Sulfotelmatobacter sp.]
ASSAAERAQFSLWRRAMLHPWLYALGGWVVRKSLRLLYGLGLESSGLDPMKAWNRKRAHVPLPARSFRKLWKQELAQKRK